MLNWISIIYQIFGIMLSPVPSTAMQPRMREKCHHWTIPVLPPFNSVASKFRECTRLSFFKFAY